MKTGSKIPVSVMHEHRDAYYHWMYMIDRGIIPAERNYLLHVDHHDDYDTRGYGRDLTAMPQTWQEALDFTDECLGIADFIVPALWQGIFSTFHNLKNLIPVKIKEQACFIKLMKGNPHVPETGDFIPALHSSKRNDPGSGYKFFTYREGGLRDGDEITDKNIVLDVDLDYFCWDDSLRSVSPKRMEITREAYEEYRLNRNHPFRLLPARVFTVTESDGKYYIEYREHLERDPLPIDKMIILRMNHLFDWFEKLRLRPRAIDICRSDISGYLPAEKAAFVEAEFRKRLEEHFDVEYIAVPERLRDPHD